MTPGPLALFSDGWVAEFNRRHGGGRAPGEASEVFRLVILEDLDSAPLASCRAELFADGRLVLSPDGDAPVTIRVVREKFDDAQGAPIRHVLTSISNVGEGVQVFGDYRGLLDLVSEHAIRLAASPFRLPSWADFTA